MLDHDFSQVYVALVDKKGYGKTMLPRYNVRPDSARARARHDDCYAVFSLSKAVSSASNSRTFGRKR